MAQVESFKEELYARCFMLSEETTHRQLRVKIVDFASYRELPDACFESLGGREPAKAAHKKLKAAKKAALAAANPAPEVYGGDAAEEGNGGAASVGTKRPRDDVVEQEELV